MRILAIERDETACNHYRIIQPMAKLVEHKLADVIFAKESDLGTEFVCQKVLESDIILVPRPSSEAWFEFLKLCRKMGKIVVSDYDDDPFNTSPLNPYYRFVGIQEVAYQWPDGTKDMLWVDGMADSYGNQGWFSVERNLRNRDLFRLNFKKSDTVTCTTPILQNALGTINPNTVVLPNLIDFSIYPKCDFNKREVRIGWQGGASHYEDLYMVHKVIERICQKHDNVKFVFFGDYRFKSLFKGIPEDRIEYTSWVRYNAYSYRLATLNIDIGICPLVDNVFNRNKSAIKYFEYSAIGAATVASNLPPYSDVVYSGKDGILVGESESDWENALEQLIVDSEKRREIAGLAYENVYENHNADKKYKSWFDEYDKLLKGERVLV